MAVQSDKRADRGDEWDETAGRQTIGRLTAADMDFRRETEEGTRLERNEDVESNELHSGVGTVCPRCGQKIEPGQEVRRTASGAYQHDSC